MPPIDTHAQETSHRIRLIHSHPFAIAITFMVILFLIGGFIVRERTQTISPGFPKVWGSSAVPLENPTAFAPANTNTTPEQNTVVATGPTHFYVYTPAQTQPVSTGLATPAVDPDFQSFLNHLQNLSVYHPLDTSVKNPGPGDTDIQSAYAFIPKMLLSTTTKVARTPADEALYAYGNKAGGVIKQFEARHTDEQDVLTAESKDRGDAQKAAALRSLAADIGSIGTDMLAIKDVPEPARAAHIALAHSYQDVGAKLALVADAGTDDKQYLAAITTYNAAATAFVGNFTALVTVFSLSNITFSQNDGGSAFSFAGASGL